ncbi:30S ribosomal protein S18 [Candidatus Curtissbacteria bacterium]|nr:30S ribosomal protein S18 [Candidatus Curtissbacteria bacterium]
MAKRLIRNLTKARNCPLCAAGVIIDFKDTNTLKRYISERGKIQGRARTGVCAKHQRQITKGIKRARFMALLPFVQG